MRILHLLVTDVYSGAENVAINIAKLTSKNNEVFYCSPDGPIRKFVEEAGITFIPLKKESVKEIKKIIDELKPDEIHAHDFRMSAKCAMTGKPFISHLHNNPPWLPNISFNSLVYLFAGKRAKKIICVSDSVMNEYIFSKYIKEKAITLLNTVDIERVHKKAKEYVSPNYDVAFIGRQTIQKDPKRFVEIIDILHRKVPSIKAVMIGGGEMFDEVETLIKQKGLENNITMKGFQSNPFPILKASKLVIMPSKWEGFGLTAVESMALGCPILASPVGGLVDIIDEQCGKICNDDDAFVNEAMRLLTDEQYYSCKRAKAIIQSEKFGDMDKYREKIDNIYQLNNTSCFVGKVN